MIGEDIERLLYNQGLLFTDRKNYEKVNSIQQVEFSVYSKNGEDGIIDYIIDSQDKVDYKKKFIEFGVQGYDNPNTRFLMEKRNWSGLLIDGSKASIKSIKNSNLYWRNELRAVNCHITRKNINSIMEENGCEGDIGLLSIDIDGNDYWIWRQIDIVKPVIVVIEYNSVFGNKHPITIPYKEDFDRTEAHFSNLYFGASLPALERVSNEKGYKLIGCNSNGDNAFFVRKDIDLGLEKKDTKEDWIESKFRESRNKSGEMSFISGRDRVSKIEEKEVYHIDKGKTLPIKNLRPLF